MQRAKSQNHDLLGKRFENIFILGKRFWKYSEIITKAKHRITNVKYKEMKLTPKLSTDITSPSWKLLFEA